MKANQITDTRGRLRREQQPLTLAESLQHLRDRAALMLTKPQDVWLRWNRADIEAVEKIIAAFARKPETKETTTMTYEVSFTLEIEADSPEEATWAAEHVQTIVQTEIRRATAAGHAGTARNRLLASITGVQFDAPREAATAAVEG